MNNLKKINTVIFDFDDTLVDSFNIIYKAYYLTAIEFGLEPVLIEELRHNFDMSIFFASHWAQAQKIYLSIYKQYALHLKPFVHAEETLKLLKTYNIPIIIISNKRGSILRHEISNILNWDKYFDLIIGGDDTQKPKPSIIPVEFAAKKLNIKISKESLFIGDSLLDMECARKSGCTSILYGNMKPQISNSIYKPDLNFINYKKIIEEIKGIL